jgi:GDSL/SGNH-like Acyl-Esterase family found in Pmr5 and Cas1p
MRTTNIFRLWCIVIVSGVTIVLDFPRITFLTTWVAETKSETRKEDEQQGFLLEEARQREDDGCGLVHEYMSAGTSTTSSGVTRSRLSANEVHSFNVLKECVQRTFIEKGGSMVRPLSPETVANLTALRCHHNVTQSTIQSVVQQSSNKTIWFIGDSILEQQFYVLLCMVHPTLELSEIVYTSQRPGTATEAIAAKFTYNHSMGSTNIIYSKFGLSWHRAESNLYMDAFPQAVASLTEMDSIILDASAHYQSDNVLKLERALHFIGNQSLASKASVYYMEPTPEEWPTSNGQFSRGCMWSCTCQTLDAARIVGRGSLHSDPNVFAENLTTHNKVPTDFFVKLYPDLAFNNTEESSACVPDCLPATWRLEFTRSIFEKTKNRVHVVPLWYQLVDRPSWMTLVGDCTHKSLEAVLLMNEQLIRSMVHHSSTQQSMSSSRRNKNRRNRKRRLLTNWNNRSQLIVADSF